MIKILDDSEEDINNDISKGGLGGLKFKKIRYLKLVSAGSMAHNNKLNMRNKDILVSLLDSDVSIFQIPR